MAFDYKNPTSSVFVNTPYSVTRENDTGTNFSVNTIGGYQEVYNLSDLDWTIPADILINGGAVLYSGNSIPFVFTLSISF